MSRKRALASTTPTDLSSKRANANATVTIAIDFGTSGTGYAYSFAGSDIIECKQPGGQDARKTLSNILLHDNGTFKSFGFDARREYAESEEGCFFINYKMLLENVDGVREPNAYSLNGKCFKLIDVITRTLEYVKNEALKETGRALPDGLQARDCQWVLTVPAIWSDKAKGFMRRAAYAAGLIDSLDSQRLLLALEPESACISCEVHTLAAPGQTFMVLDAGGGTVDITMSRLKSASPLRFDEVVAPSGGPWGSTLIDDRFESFVSSLIGAGNFKKIKKTPYWIELLENWESVKTSQTAEDNPRTINMSPLLEILEDVKLGALVDSYNAQEGSSLKMRGRSTVVMTGDFVRELFKPNFHKIAKHCAELIAANPVDLVFLVGGFAESVRHRRPFLPDAPSRARHAQGPC